MESINHPMLFVSILLYSFLHWLCSKNGWRGILISLPALGNVYLNGVFFWETWAYLPLGEVLSLLIFRRKTFGKGLQVHFSKELEGWRLYPIHNELLCQGKSRSMRTNTNLGN